MFLILSSFSTSSLGGWFANDDPFASSGSRSFKASLCPACGPAAVGPAGAAGVAAGDASADGRIRAGRSSIQPNGRPRPSTQTESDRAPRSGLRYTRYPATNAEARPIRACLQWSVETVRRLPGKLGRTCRSDQPVLDSDLGTCGCAGEIGCAEHNQCQTDAHRRASLTLPLVVHLGQPLDAPSAAAIDDRPLSVAPRAQV